MSFLWTSGFGIMMWVSWGGQGILVKDAFPLKNCQVGDKQVSERCGFTSQLKSARRKDTQRPSLILHADGALKLLPLILC